MLKKEMNSFFLFKRYNFTKKYDKKQEDENDWYTKIVRIFNCYEYSSYLKVKMTKKKNFYAKNTRDNTKNNNKIGLNRI
jgi:hypothetical protein